MVIVKLKGGIGNQLFQYGVGFSLSKKLNTNLLLDLSFYNSQNNINKDISNRKFELNYFRINHTIASKNDISKFLKQTIFTKLIIFINKNLYFYYKEKSLLFDDNVFKNKSKNIYLDGYWQSEKYFIEYKDELKNIFTNFNIPKELHLFKNLIINTNSVAVHIRRGDYINDIKTNQVHGFCDISYYENAIAMIINKVDNPVFYFFSDDINWVYKEFNKFKDIKKYFQNNLTDPIIDITLMSFCKHNIIANSTFSWWGAWLNKNENKLVFAPKKWFRDETLIEIIPENWIQI